MRYVSHNDKINVFSFINQTSHSKTNISKGQSFIFVLPMIIDKSLKKYEDSVRLFFSMQFMAEIKRANILNVTSNIIDLYLGVSKERQQIVKTKDTDFYAERLRMLDDERKQTTAQQYEYKREQFNKYIENQIRNDPIYSSLKPVVSSVTIEDFIEIPLVIGTKSFKVDTLFNYWFLYFSIVKEIPLDVQNQTKINDIEYLMKNLKAKNHAEVIFDSTKNVSPHAQNKQDDIRLDNITKNMYLTLKNNLKRYSRVLNKIDLEKDIGLGSADNENSTITSTLLGDDSPDLIKTRNSALLHFTNSFVKYLLPLLKDISYVFSSPLDTDLYDKLERFNNHVVVGLQTGISSINLSNFVGSGDGSTVENVNDKFKVFSNNCKNINTVKIDEIFSTLSKINMELSTLDRRGGKDFANLIEHLMDSNIQTVGFINILEQNLLENAHDEHVIKTLFHGVRDDVFEESLKFFFLDGNNPIVTPDSTDTTNIERFRELAGIENNEDFKNILNMLKRKIVEDDVFTQIKTILNKYNKTSATVDDKIKEMMLTFLNTTISQIKNMLYFLFLYSFATNLCKLIQKVSITFETKKRESIEFPNYCTVIPIEFIKRYYNAISSASYKYINKKTGSIDPAFTLHTVANEFKFIETSDAKIINKTLKVLKIPNIIIIDKTKKLAYYKWKHMFGAMQIGLSQIDSYIKNQKDYYFNNKN